jgi:hypothetical protein
MFRDMQKEKMPNKPGELVIRGVTMANDAKPEK